MLPRTVTEVQHSAKQHILFYIEHLEMIPPMRNLRVGCLAFLINVGFDEFRGNRPTWKHVANYEARAPPKECSSFGDVGRRLRLSYIQQGTIGALESVFLMDEFSDRVLGLGG